MATTLLLDRQTWDICVTTAGDIAVASEPYSQSQDVASECRLFLGEAYYDTSRGISYFADVLGKLQPDQVIRESMARAAQLVPGVTAATVRLGEIEMRTLSGQIQFQTDAGSGVAVL